jgi:tetratricopeptide (TPR) repeat protein
LPYRNRLPEAEDHYREAIRLMAQVVGRYPEQAEYKLGLAESYGNLGLLHHSRQRVEEAENAFQRADGLLAPLLGDGRPGFMAATSRSSVAINWGNLYLQRGQTDKALSSYDRGLRWSEDVLRQEPTYAPARDMVLKLHGSKALAYDAHQRFAEAATEWKRTIEFAKGSARLDYRMRRCVSLARGSDSTRAAEEVEALATDPGCSPDMLYNVACVFSLAHRADKAISVLHKLQLSGYFDKAENLNTLRADTDFDSLRQRDDFLKLIDRLNAHFPRPNRSVR